MWKQKTCTLYSVDRRCGKEKNLTLYILLTGDVVEELYAQDKPVEELP